MVTTTYQRQYTTVTEPGQVVVYQSDPENGWRKIKTYIGSEGIHLHDLMQSCQEENCSDERIDSLIEQFITAYNW